MNIWVYKHKLVIAALLGTAALLGMSLLFHEYSAYAGCVTNC
jgi:hypothetical protein